jgi:BetR domain
MKAKNTKSIQVEFVKVLKAIVPNEISIADELADLLEISTDSAYRRLRNETDFTLEEIYRICSKYYISVDSVFSHKSDTVTCNYTTLTDSEENLEKYLNGLQNQLKSINAFDEKKIIYAAEEMPIMHSFFNEELAAFKLFYWQRSVLNLPHLQGKKFAFDIISPQLLKVAKGIHEEYMAIPAIEIWTDETILTVIKQVEFYYESGAFATKEDAVLILENVKKMAESLSSFAEQEQKLNVGKRAGGSYHLYNCDLVIGTNCIHVKAGTNNFSYISFNTMNSLTTANQVFCNEIEQWMKNLIRKSSLISGSAEKQRFQFFKSMHKQIDASIEKIKNY